MLSQEELLEYVRKAKYGDENAKEIMFSNTAITVDIAAKIIKRKNNAPHMRPPGIELNTFGIVWKRSEGPESGLMLYAKHEGITIRPATIATNVSREAIITVSPKRLLSLLM